MGSSDLPQYRDDQAEPGGYDYRFTEDEQRAMTEIIQRLGRQMRGALAHRRTVDYTGRINVAQTIRSSMKYDGIPFVPVLARRQDERPRLVVICDISLSVRHTARFMLHLLYSLQALFTRVRSFVFVSDLAEVSALFERLPLDTAIGQVFSGAVIDPDANSNYGRALELFYEQHRGAITPRTTVLILGETGAEQLLGQGDMLYMAHGGRITRVHGPFVADKEVEDVVAHLKAQASPDYVEEVTEEDESGGSVLPGSGDSGGSDGGENDLYRQAVQVVCQHKKASTSFVQRQLAIGYNRAARLIERMENEGIVSPANHVGKREILDEHAGERVHQPSRHPPGPGPRGDRAQQPEEGGRAHDVQVLGVGVVGELSPGLASPSRGRRQYVPCPPEPRPRLP